MGWSADWRIPRGRIDESTLRDVLERECARAGYALGYLVAKDDTYTHAGIAIDVDGRSLSGCLELWANEPTEAGETAWNLVNVDEMIEFEDTDIDEDGYPVENLLPGNAFGFGEVSLEHAEIVGDGHGRIVLDRYRNTASVHRVISLDLAEAIVVSDRFLLGLSGLVRAHGRTWAFGGPSLLIVDGTRVPVIFNPEISEQQIAALHPFDRRRALAVLDDGSAWRIDCESGATERIASIPATANYGGYWDFPGTIAVRGDELWFANDSDCIYRLVGDEVVPVKLDWIERVAVASDGKIWLQRASELLVGDGTDAASFEVAYSPDAYSLQSLVAGRAGTVIAFTPGPPAWRAEQDGLPREQAASKLVVFDGGGMREVLLEHKAISFKAARCTAGDLVWASTGDHVLAIEPGGPLHTRLTVRSNRDDNREDAVWERMCTFALSVATALGGWDATRP